MAISTTAKAEAGCGLPPFPMKLSKGWFAPADADDPDRPLGAEDLKTRWQWVNEKDDHWAGQDGESINIDALPGSVWTTPDARKETWGDESGQLPPPTNMLQLTGGDERLKSFSIRVRCTHSRHAEELGVFAWVDAMNWVKVVLCGAKGEPGSVNVIMAQQINGIPFVKGKVALGERHGWNELSPQSQRLGEDFVQLPVSLRLSYIPPEADEGGPGTMRGEYAVSNGGWQPVCRGNGWLEDEELFGQRPRGHLLDGDHRGGKVAECDAPEKVQDTDWSWVLAATNFADENRWVTFERLAGPHSGTA